MATINLRIYVPDIAATLALYDVIHVQRSVTAPPGETPVDLTEDTAQAAVLVGANEGPYVLNGKTVEFKVNGTSCAVTFVSPDPIAIPDVVDEVHAALILAGLPAVASQDSGKLKLSTLGLGTQYTLEIIAGTGLIELGFTAGDKDNGESAHVPLSVGVDTYEFVDGSGQQSYYYRTRYLNTVDETFSAWSDWVQGTTAAAVDAAHLIIAKVQLADLDGTALANRKIIIRNVHASVTVDGYGIFGNAIELETDALGMAETALVKGSHVDVIFSGTSIVRRIIVPTSGTEFDLLDSSLVEYDAFDIQIPDLPYAPRRA